MSFNYAYSDLSTAVNSVVHGKTSNLVNERALYNRGVRELAMMLDLRSAKRRVTIAPGIYTNVYNYPLPIDVKGMAICDLVRQVNRREDWVLTSIQEFDQRKSFNKDMLAISDENGIRYLRVATELNTQEEVLNPVDSITDEGTWVASGDASALAVDNVNYIGGSGSLEFSTASSSSSALITNSTQPKMDLTSYNNQQLFLYVFIPTTTGLTSFTLKWGTDASNYWSQTVTVNNEGTNFYTGWNLLRFNWPATETGSPTISNIEYLQFAINKTSSMPAQSTWRINYLVVRIPDIHDLIYYTKYGWTNAAGTFIENSTLGTDLLVADTDEFDLTVKYCGALASQELRNKDAKDVKTDAMNAIEYYKVYTYPSERLLYQTTYERFASLEGDNDVFNSFGTGSN